MLMRLTRPWPLSFDKNLSRPVELFGCLIETLNIPCSFEDTAVIKSSSICRYHYAVPHWIILSINIPVSDLLNRSCTHLIWLKIIYRYLDNNHLIHLGLWTVAMFWLSRQVESSLNPIVSLNSRTVEYVLNQWPRICCLLALLTSPKADSRSPLIHLMTEWPLSVCIQTLLR